ncbi:MAG: NADPH-dependent FMN reductase [Myxococcales bacterium]
MELRIGVIIGSTREGRQGERVARWVAALAGERSGLAVELVDLRDFPLPFYPHAQPTKLAEAGYADPVQRRWVETVSRLDGFIVVTPEYNHAPPAALKNALDFAYAGWNRKPVAFVSYGGVSGGIRAVQQLRQIAVELQLAPIRDEVNVPFVGKAFDAAGQPVDAIVGKRAAAMLDGLTWWTRVLKEGRANHPA